MIDLTLRFIMLFMILALYRVFASDTVLHNAVIHNISIWGDFFLTSYRIMPVLYDVFVHDIVVLCE